MTLPVVPGNSMSFSQINTELGFASTTLISLNQATVRTLAGVGASPATIAITNLSGKANQFAFTISTNQTNANLRTLAVNAGWNQSSKVVATIGSGVYISSNAVGTPALTVNGSFPGGVDLINGGFIVGMGGNGGNATSYTAGDGGGSGGLGLSVSVAVTITNNSTIAGGGGGGGGGGSAGEFAFKGYAPLCGGGGGGGRSSNAANSSGGTLTKSYAADSAQVGGTGTVSSAGSGGLGGGQPDFGIPRRGGNGGSGGGWGATGSSGGSGGGNCCNNNGGGSGGTAGNAITGNSNITYVTTGTRLGPIS